jgi:hypothetical protein
MRIIGIILATIALTGCTTSGLSPFLSEQDFDLDNQAVLSEEEVNGLMFKVVSQLGVPQNFLDTTSRGGLVAGTGAGMSMELTCAEGVKQFEKTNEQTELTVYLDFDAKPCFEKILAQASAAQRQKMKLLMDLESMQTRVYTKSACALKPDARLPHLSALNYLTEGTKSICSNTTDGKILMNYAATIKATVMGQPMTTQALLLISQSDKHSCNLGLSAGHELNTNGCAIMMRLTAPAGKDFVMVVKSVGVQGSVNLPYFTMGHYDINLNGWVGRVTFSADRNPAWKLSRNNELAQGEFDGRGIITH